METSKQSTDLLIRLANDILIFHRIESGVEKMTFSENSFYDIANEVISAMTPLIRTKKLEIKTDIEENLTKLFRKLIQIDSAKKVARDRTGLGLVISKKIIESHGGQVMLDSIYGKGSAFSFTILLTQQS